MTHAAEPDDEQPERPAQTDRRGPWRWATLVLALIAIVATGLAIWAFVRPTSNGASAPTTQQVVEAKARACSAYDKARTAVALQSQVAADADPTATQLVAVNARLAMAVGSQHIVDNLDPAVPTELADSLRSVASGLQDLAINALAGTSGDQSAQVAQLHELEATSQKIVDLCK